MAHPAGVWNHDVFSGMIRIGDFKGAYKYRFDTQGIEIPEEYKEKTEEQIQEIKEVEDINEMMKVYADELKFNGVFDQDCFKTHSDIIIQATEKAGRKNIIKYLKSIDVEMPTPAINKTIYASFIKNYK
jgi:hypothetical protein